MLNPESLLRVDQPVRYALTGANGGFGRTLLAQTAMNDNLFPAILCDLNIEGVLTLLREIGYENGRPCETRHQVLDARVNGEIPVVASAELIIPECFDVLVEATGNPGFGYRVARSAIASHRHCVMASKEVDSVGGLHLSELARQAGVVYTPPAGDQPANLLMLIGYLRILGFEPVAVGKASEYDLVWDPAEGTVTQWDTVVPVPEMADLFTMGEDVARTLEARDAAVRELQRDASADFCEMAVVAAHSGLGADKELLHYPVARAGELADIYRPSVDGGILSGTGVVDVFRALRARDEASFAGGVFAVVRTHDERTWRLLAGKGHVISEDGRYACLYLPYHWMGVETPATILGAVKLGIGAGTTRPAGRTVLAGRANSDLVEGTVLRMGGHHHDVDGVQAVLLDRAAHSDLAPLYLAGNCRLARRVAAGEVLRLDDLADPDAELVHAWRAGVEAQDRWCGA